MKKITERIIELTMKYERLAFYKRKPFYLCLWLLSLGITIIMIMRNYNHQQDSWFFILGILVITIIPILVLNFYIRIAKKSIKRRLIGIMEHNKNKPVIRYELKNHMDGYRYRIDDILGYSLEWIDI